MLVYLDMSATRMLEMHGEGPLFLCEAPLTGRWQANGSLAPLLPRRAAYVVSFNQVAKPAVEQQLQSRASLVKRENRTSPS